MMNDQQLAQLGITDQEFFCLKHLWNTIAPLEPNGYDCRCKEEYDWNMTHADAVLIINGKPFPIVDIVDFQEQQDMEYRRTYR